MRILKILSLAAYFIILIDTGDYTAPWFLLLIYGFINPAEGFWLVMSSIIIWLAIFSFAWTILKPNIKRDKLLIPILLIILNLPFLLSFVYFFKFSNQIGFIISYSIYFLITLLYLTIQRIEKWIGSGKSSSQK